MKIGTRSVLFGAHQFLLHPLCVAIAWWKLYGFPKDWRLWVSFFVHDIGYFNCSNMDGEEGEAHALIGGVLMSWWFGKEWGDFTVFHSRFYAKKMGVAPSRLCLADKYAFCVMPRWLYLLMVRATGEIREYQAVEKHRAETGFVGLTGSWSEDVEWHNRLHKHLLEYVHDKNNQISARLTDAMLKRGPQ